MVKTYEVDVTVARYASSGSIASVPVNGYLKGIKATAGTMDDNDTYTLAITDKHSATVFSRASLADAGVTTIWADKYNELSTTKVEGALLNTPMAGDITVTITPSTQQDAAAVAYSIVIYYE